MEQLIIEYKIPVIEHNEIQKIRTVLNGPVIEYNRASHDRTVLNRVDINYTLWTSYRTKIGEL